MENDKITVMLSGRAVYKAVKQYMTDNTGLSKAMETALSQYLEKALIANPKFAAQIKASLESIVRKLIQEQLEDLKDAIDHMVEGAIRKRLTPTIIKEALKNLAK